MTSKVSYHQACVLMHHYNGSTWTDRHRNQQIYCRWCQSKICMLNTTLQYAVVTQHNNKHHTQNQVNNYILNMNIHLYSNIHTYRHSLIYTISDIHNLEKVKKFETCIKFFFAGIKAQQNEANRRTVLGKSTHSMCSCYRWSDSRIVESGFQLDSPAYSYINDNMHTQFWLPKISTCTRPSRT